MIVDNIKNASRYFSIDVSLEQIFKTILAFCHDDNIRSPYSGKAFAQTAERQYIVLPDGAVAVNEQNIQPGLDVAVLVGVIEQYRVKPWHLGCELFDACNALFAYSNTYVGVFVLYLERLVTYQWHRSRVVGVYISFALATVTAAQHCYPAVFAQQFYKVFCMRRLAGAAYRYVAYAYSGNGEYAALDYAHIEHDVPYPGNPAVRVQCVKNRSCYTSCLFFHRFQMISQI